MSARVAGLLALSVVVAGLAAVPSAAVSGGTPVPDGTYPFLAKIDVGGVRGCTGALVAPQWLVSAASCFAESGQPLSAGPPPRPSTAIVGRIPLSGTTGQSLSIVDLVPREDRNVVLAKLATSVFDVTPMTVATTAPAAGETLRVTGFGRTATEWAPDRPHSADFTVGAVAGVALDLAASAGEADPCKGDAGGPELREVAGRVEAVALNSTSWQHGCLGTNETRHGVTGIRLDDLAGWINNLVTPRFPDPELNLAAHQAIATSSALTGIWAAANVVDGQRTTGGASYGWSSADKPNEDHAESITVDLGQSQPLGRVDLYPRTDDPFTGLGFPIDFTIQVSEDNTNWITAATRTGYARPGTGAQPFPLGGRPGRYVKITGTKLSQPNGQFFMQFAEIEIS